MNFIDWLNKRLKQEAGEVPASAATTTANIAVFPRPVLFNVRDSLFPRKRKKKV